MASTALKAPPASLILLVLIILSSTVSAERNETEYEYAPYDGWYNNRAHPDWGGAETQLIRRVSTAYSDGVFEPAGINRPNPIYISEQLMSGPTGLPSYRNRTALLVFFGQQVVEEILDAQRPGCPPEYFNIKIPQNHSQYNPEGAENKEMPFLRSRYDMRTGLSPNNPRQQLNEISSYIDGTLMYGPNKAWTDALRSFQGGRLAAANDNDPSEGFYPAYNDIRLPMANPPPPADHVLKPIKRFFRLGNPRGNENPFLLTFGILWFRWHNFKARQIEAEHPDWSDEKLFNEARKWTIAVYQKLVMYDWLPAWLNATIPPYEKYNPQVHPGIAAVFQTTAMRFGHTLVPPGVYRRNKDCVFHNTTETTGFSGHRAVRTCNSYWNPQDSVKEYDIDEFLMGMASQIAEREDNIITPDLRGDVFGPLEFSRRDLMALNIQRARDHGVPDYNTVRMELGLERITKFEDINPDLFENNADLLDRLKTVYNNNIDDIDIWVGGLLETTGAGPGELFQTIILDQFLRIRNGDRFWFENYKLNGLFTEEEVGEIWNVTLIDVITAVTNITTDDIQENPFFHMLGDKCPQPDQLVHDNEILLAPCTSHKTFDYFSGSEWAFILSLVALGLFILLSIVLLLLIAWRHTQRVQKQRALSRQKSAKKMGAVNKVTATEWMGWKEGERNVVLELDEQKNHIRVLNERHKVYRTIDLNVPIRRGFEVEILLGADRYMRTMALRVRNEYDLILKFDGMSLRSDFLGRALTFFKKLNVRHNATPRVMSEKLIFKNASTKKDRQQLLEKFFRVIFARAFKYKSEHDNSGFEAKDNQEILMCELTKSEFAEALSLKMDSLFIENMFNLVDKDNDGYVSFREFLDVIIIFAKGDANEKAKLLFNMYDLDQDEILSKPDFEQMCKSLLELASETIDEAKINEAVNSMFGNKEHMTLNDFVHILRDYKDALHNASLNFDGIENVPTNKQNVPRRLRNTVRAYRSETDERRVTTLGVAPQKRPSIDNLKTTTRNFPQTPTQERINAFLNYWENQKRQIFWLFLYTMVCIGIFAERAYYYSVEREHAGLRRIAGYGVTVTRGAASGMMFTYSCLLVTMCRNLITFLRETFLNRYIPFDGYISFHIYIAILALIFTVMHIIGHGINFYHISTQTADDLTCLFRNFFHATDELPKFQYWMWGTLTGFTGVLLTLVTILIYTFAIPYSRRHAFRAFWFTHNMYPVFFALMVLHGAGRLVQPPFFHYFFLGPVILFTLDRLISVSRKKVEIAIVKAELLPSDVTYLEFKRPQNFEYKSGQWVRIASLVQSKHEYHPFTLTSAPHEENLSVHIRAVGPWTLNLRKIYDPNLIRDHPYPKIYLDGAYGEGHQDWYKYEVAVLVGGGIGVTPFASILKDIAHKSANSDKNKVFCKKVYFLWVTRTQRQFEWMTDIIRQVEEKDISDLVATHIFITQFKEKFDIRTTMLYICERHFQKISNRSLFTGLRSVTHFGRPDFDSFFKLLLHKHPDASAFGVFSCGPPPMTSNVEKACSSVNKCTSSALFVHHFENF